MDIKNIDDYLVCSQGTQAEMIESYAYEGGSGATVLSYNGVVNAIGNDKARSILESPFYGIKTSFDKPQRPVSAEEDHALNLALARSAKLISAGRLIK